MPNFHSLYTCRRDHGYIRHGTMSLPAGIDRLSGEVLGLLRNRHRSAEFIAFLKLADGRVGIRAPVIRPAGAARA